MLKLPPDFFPKTVARAPQDVTTLDFRGTELIVHTDTLLPTQQSRATATRHLDIGEWQSRSWIARQFAADTELADNEKAIGLRALFGRLDEPLIALAALGLQLLEWDRTHTFCGACGTRTERAADERARRCPACGHAAYPRISPAMMCLVTRGDDILLARNVNFPPGRYSALAGFLEAGESVEDAIHREVREEVGIEVKNLRYFSSQSWPFPHSLMLAFTAEYAGGTLTPNGVEIVDAQWCKRDSLPELPPPLSIARALIEHTLATH